MQAVTTIGLDIAKSVFQVHGIDAEGKVLIRRQLKRRCYVLAFFEKLPAEGVPFTPSHANSVLFFLGQHHQGIAPCVVYEFDFDRKGNKSYQPSFVID